MKNTDNKMLLSPELISRYACAMITSNLPAHSDANVVRPAEEPPVDDMRDHIVAAAEELIRTGGRSAATTRAISAAAGVQPPAIYRHFRDLRGLLDEAARNTFTRYLRQKTADDFGDMRLEDPVEAVQRGWDRHVSFGVSYPDVYVLIYGDPALEFGVQGERFAIREGEAHLRTLVTRVAEAGRLRVSVAHAVRMIAAAGNGVTLALIGAAPSARDPRLSEAVREAVLAAITVPPADDDIAGSSAARSRPRATGAERVAASAVALHAVLADTDALLTPGESQLLVELLDRLANGSRPTVHREEN